MALSQTNEQLLLCFIMLMVTRFGYSQDNIVDYLTTETTTETISSRSPPLTEEIFENEDMIITLDDPDVIVVGDMILTIKQYQHMFLGINQRKGIAYEQMRWSKEGDYPTVPYLIDGEGDNFLKTITESINHWEEHTCIKFRQITERQEGKSHLGLNNYGSGCRSYVGRVSSTVPQNVSLPSGCHSTKIAIHELGHAIGFTHEQNRPDRDKYLKLMVGNIRKDMKFNFDKEKADQFKAYGVPVDYTSIMMYPGRDFSITGALTIRTKNIFNQGLLGASDVLSHRDKQAVNIMYKCLDFWLRSCDYDMNVCENNGYVGKNCNCVCPPGTEGEKCQHVVGDYYPSPKCNRNISDSDTHIQSPNYPEIVPNGTWCVYQITAPENHHIEVQFESFYIQEYSVQERCRIAVMIFMELQLEDDLGFATCGYDFAPGDVYTSTTNELTIYFEASSDSSWTKGFSARIQFIRIETLPPVDTTVGKTTTTATTTTTTTPCTTTTTTTTTTPCTTTTTTPTTTPTTTTTTTTSKTTVMKTNHLCYILVFASVLFL